MSQITNIGIIGTGRIGTYHAKNIEHNIPEASVVALMDLDHSKAKTLAQEFSNCMTYNESEHLIAAPNVDAILIAAPDELHSELLLQCIESNKPVFCEKPIATNSNSAKSIVQAEMELGTRLIQIGFMREYDPAHSKVKMICDHGVLGKILAFRSYSSQTIDLDQNSKGNRKLSDIIINSMIHDFHSARWVMNQEVSKLYVSSIIDNSPNTARFVMVNLEFEDGSLGIIEYNDNSGFGYTVDIKITGELGSTESSSLSDPIIYSSNSKSQSITNDWLERFQSAYLIELRNWVKSIQNKTIIGPSTWDGYMSLKIAEACIESSKTGKLINIPSIPKPSFYE